MRVRSGVTCLEQTMVTVKEMDFEMYNFRAGDEAGKGKPQPWGGIDERGRERRRRKKKRRPGPKQMGRGEDPPRQRLDFRAHFSGGFSGF